MRKEEEGRREKGDEESMNIDRRIREYPGQDEVGNR